MKSLIVVALAVAVAAGCSQQEEYGETHYADETILALGTLTEFGGHGNGYTNVTNESLTDAGVEPGDRILLTFATAQIDFTVGTGYDDVPDGENVAVLHREGTLVLAVYNGDFSQRYGLQPGMSFTVTRIVE